MPGNESPAPEVLAKLAERERINARLAAHFCGGPAYGSSQAAEDIQRLLAAQPPGAGEPDTGIIARAIEEWHANPSMQTDLTLAEAVANALLADRETDGALPPDLLFQTEQERARGIVACPACGGNGTYKRPFRDGCIHEEKHGDIYREAVPATGGSQPLGAGERETMVVESIRGCARCGGEHEAVTVRRFLDPPDFSNGWALCPTTGDPILFTVSAWPVPASGGSTEPPQNEVGRADVERDQRECSDAPQSTEPCPVSPAPYVATEAPEPPVIDLTKVVVEHPKNVKRAQAAPEPSAPAPQHGVVLVGDRHPEEWQQPTPALCPVREAAQFVHDNNQHATGAAALCAALSEPCAGRAGAPRKEDGWRCACGHVEDSWRNVCTKCARLQGWAPPAAPEREPLPAAGGACPLQNEAQALLRAWRRYRAEPNRPLKHGMQVFDHEFGALEQAVACPCPAEREPLKGEPRREEQLRATIAKAETAFTELVRCLWPKGMEDLTRARGILATLVTTPAGAERVPVAPPPKEG